MKIKYETQFEKDLKKLHDGKLFDKVKECINSIKESESIDAVPQAKKLKGHTSFYRIRLGRYRIGFELIGDEIVLTRILHRKDIYRYFP